MLLEVYTFHILQKALYKCLLQKAEVAQEEILTLTVQSFLTKYYFSDSNSRVLSEVGIVINDTEHIRSGYIQLTYYYI